MSKGPRTSDKPAAPGRGLDEVERAISLLEGRHPEHERTKRETREAAANRRLAMAKEAALRSRRRRWRALVAVTNLAALSLAGFVTSRFVQRTRALRVDIDRVTAPFVAHGFAVVASNDLTGSSAFESDVPGGSCFVAVTAGSDAIVHVRAGSVRAEGRGSVAWCACAPARASIDLGAARAGLALLRADARIFGGPHARPWVTFSPGAWGDGDAECAEETLDAWIADGRWPRPPIEGVRSDAVGALMRFGFRLESRIEKARPFGVVDVAPGECAVAIASGEDVSSIRATGGAWLLRGARGSLAWCSAKGGRVTLWREGPSDVIVLAAPSARVGGLLGARECAETAGARVAPESTWLRDEDLVWDAAMLLGASAVSDIGSSDVPAETGKRRGAARISVIALSPDARVATDPTDTVVACDPPLDARPRAGPSVCAEPPRISWWRRNDAPAGMAFAPLPFWLSAFDTHSEPDALARIPELLSLARHLAREGFEPTIVDGVTEIEDGVRVVGRAGEDAIIAIGFGPQTPWVFPYTDGVPWDLGDAPRSIKLRSGEAIKLVSSPRPNISPERRKTVVFRHPSHP